MKFHFFDRLSEPGKPGGVTVSKSATLPKGDFIIAEYKWPRAFSYPPYVSLWFVDADNFTAHERQQACGAWLDGQSTETPVLTEDE